MRLRNAKRYNREKAIAIALGVLATVLISGCGKEAPSEIEVVEAEDIPAREEEPATVGGEEDIFAEEPDQGEPAKASEEKTEEPEGGGDTGNARIEKYQEVLTGVFEKQTYPDGTDCGYDGFYPLSDNKFAVIDVDKDGKEELIICFITSSMAGMREVVYDYDENTDSVVEEYTGFPGAVFYENGLIEEGLSHNQGMAPLGDFWPYMLYRYRSETDDYECICMVDAWEKEYRAEDYDGNPYPEEIDTEKSGIVFFIMEDGNYNTASTEPIGKGAYEEWRRGQGLDSPETKITFQELTEENIGKMR